MKILNYKKEEMNPFVDSRYSNNGGGYSQPLYRYEIQQGLRTHIIEVEDSSCGEFGDRITISIDGKVVSYYDHVGGCNEWNEISCPMHWHWLRLLGWARWIGYDCNND